VVLWRIWRKQNILSFFKDYMRDLKVEIGEINIIRWVEEDPWL
jgi:hypothetical protein